MQATHICRWAHKESRWAGRRFYKDRINEMASRHSGEGRGCGRRLTLFRGINALTRVRGGGQQACRPRGGGPMAEAHPCVASRSLWRSYADRVLSTSILYASMPISLVRPQMAAERSKWRSGHVHDGHRPERTGQARTAHCCKACAACRAARCPHSRQCRGERVDHHRRRQSAPAVSDHGDCGVGAVGLSSHTTTSLQSCVSLLQRR